MQIELRNFFFESQNVGKRLNWSKKCYSWTFEASIQKPDQPEMHQKYRIQFLDSLNSGKRTITLNDNVVLFKTKINNFAIEPYTVQKDPLKLQISKHTKKGSMFKQYELLIENREFHVLKSVAGCNILLENQQIFIVYSVKIDRPTEQKSENEKQSAAPQSDNSEQNRSSSSPQTQPQNHLSQIQTPIKMPENNTFLSPNLSNDTCDFDFQNRSSITGANQQQEFDFLNFSNTFTCSNQNSSDPNLVMNRVSSISDQLPQNSSYLINGNFDTQINNTTVQTNKDLVKSSEKQSHVQDFFEFRTNCEQTPSTSTSANSLNTNANYSKNNNNNFTQQHSNHANVQRSTSTLLPFEDFFQLNDASNPGQPQNIRKQSFADVGDLLCLDEPPKSQANQNQDQNKKFNPEPYSFITGNVPIQQQQYNPGMNFMTNNSFIQQQHSQHQYTTQHQMIHTPNRQSQINPMMMYNTNNNFNQQPIMQQQQQIPPPFNTNQGYYNPANLYQSNLPQQNIYNVNQQPNPSVIHQQMTYSNQSKDFQMQHILKEVNGFNKQGFDHFEKVRKQHDEVRQNNDKLGQQLGSLLKFD
ncbi:UNKNOWN [Stylonychia lemnae]|uniref:Uncharacterized protein n=1 Tax=Stylonychia lemnae TaxID=5949 RepID=A0A078ABM9_STYLE|nr:UNKNOWN [Stylonychia lemnae]|eukprot:CDW79276.1 UNKNOWN [Stylonychia lemnae]